MIYTSSICYVLISTSTTSLAQRSSRTRMDCDSVQALKTVLGLPTSCSLTSSTLRFNFHLSNLNLQLPQERAAATPLGVAAAVICVRERYAKLSSIISVNTSLMSRPAARTCWGMKLVAVMPGVVLISSRFNLLPSVMM